jgi:hypothetical protein
MRQPDVKEQIMNGNSQLIRGLDIHKPSGGWIYHCGCKQRACLEWCLPPDLHKP